jgi:hypothetical protein
MGGTPARLGAVTLILKGHFEEQAHHQRGCMAIVLEARDFGTQIYEIVLKNLR